MKIQLVELNINDSFKFKGKIHKILSFDNHSGSWMMDTGYEFQNPSTMVEKINTKGLIMITINENRTVNTCFGEENMLEAFKEFGLNEEDFKSIWWTEDKIAGYIEHFTCKNDVRIKKDNK